MLDKIFFDSNILIYAYSIDEQKKQKMVQDLLNRHEIIIISTQTVNEFINATVRKKILSHVQIAAVVDELFSVFRVEIIDQSVIKRAVALATKYHYSYFDSLMLSSALTSDCSILYSEDMHHTHNVENKLKIINPFVNRVVDS